jgi:hypothetical protein
MATKASCHFGLGERDQGIGALMQVRFLGAEPAALESIRRGLIRLHEGLDGTDEELKVWLDALTGA